jgi:hypothetical protein
MTRIYQLWEATDPDQKGRLQKLIFPEASASTEGTSNSSNLIDFSVLGSEMTENAGLVAHTGFEPVLPA